MPYRLFGFPDSLFDVSTSLRSSGSRRPRLLSKAVHPLTGFEPSSETPSGAALIVLSSANRQVAFLGSSPEVFCPFSGIIRRIGCRPVPPGHLPSSTFRRSLRASSSPSVASLFHPAAAHGVHPLQSFSLPTNSPRLVAWRSPLGVLSDDQWPKVAPSGVYVNRQSVSRLRSIASFVRPMLSWVFSRFRGVPALRSGSVSRRLIRSWLSLRLRTGRLRSSPSAFSYPVRLASLDRSSASRPSVFTLPSLVEPRFYF